MKNKPREGFTALFRTYYEEVCSHIFRYVKDARVSEDVAQELFSELWTKRETLEIQKSPGAYLHRMAVTRALNYIRDNKHHLYSTEDELRTVKASTVQPDELIESDQLSILINGAIDDLPERCRQVFMLSRFDGMKNSEIATELDISIKTVENQMTKALKSLRIVVKNFQKEHRG